MKKNEKHINALQLAYNLALSRAAQDMQEDVNHWGSRISYYNGLYQLGTKLGLSVEAIDEDLSEHIMEEYEARQQEAV